MSTMQAAALVPKGTWRYLVDQIMFDNPSMRRDVADRILGQTLGFMQVCALRANGQPLVSDRVAAEEIEGISPSRIVDKGWHAVILTDTTVCADIHDKLGVDFLHHRSYNAEQKAVRSGGGVIPDLPRGAGDLALTAGLMRANGITVDEELWRDELPQYLTAMVAEWDNRPDCYEKCPCWKAEDQG